MTTTLFVVIFINILVFAALAVWAVRYALNEDQPRIRTIAWALAAVAVAFVLGAASRLVVVGEQLGWIDFAASDFLTSEWHLVQSVGATTLGVVGVLVVRRVGRPLREADRIAGHIAERMPTVEEFDAFGLTNRELEVLAVIASGKVSDRDIAESLYISPATAGTHVKNILRKTGVSNRRDLATIATARRS